MVWVCIRQMKFIHRASTVADRLKTKSVVVVCRKVDQRCRSGFMVLEGVDFLLSIALEECTPNLLYVLAMNPELWDLAMRLDS